MNETPPTRDRILAAAGAEFAAHGYSGARIDRIAETASANKERIYAYFGDKDGLFREVLACLSANAGAWLPQNGRNLATATGDLFDAAFTNPQLLRLLAWRRLENPDAHDEQEQETISRKVEDIRDAQQAGHIDPSWDPADVLAMLAALAGTWANAPTGLARLAETDGRPIRDRRTVIEEAMRRILRP